MSMTGTLKIGFVVVNAQASKISGCAYPSFWIPKVNVMQMDKQKRRDVFWDKLTVRSN